MNSLSDTVRVISVASCMLAVFWYLRRSRSPGNPSIRLVIAAIVLVAVGILMAVTLVTMLQVSSTIPK